MVLSLGKTIISHKIAERQALAKAKTVCLQHAAKSQADWQAFMADASAQSLKDEAWTLCFIVILAMCFIPATQAYVREGFALSSETPDWFRWALLASIGTSFGLRGFAKFNQGKSSQTNASLLYHL